MKLKVSFTIGDGLPNLTAEERNSIHGISLAYKLKAKPIKIPFVPAVGMKIMINSFYCSYKFTKEECLVWNKCFDADENTSLEIYSIGIRKKYLELFLR